MDGLIPCAGGIGAFLIVFGFIAYLRYLRHKEILALAEQGLSYPERKNGGKDALRWGIIITAIGIALLVGLLPIAINNAWPLTLGGLIPTFFGLGLILIHFITKKDDDESRVDEEEQIDPLEEPEAMEED